MRQCGSHGGHWAAGRHRRGRFGRRGYGPGGPGSDGDDVLRAGRMLAQGDLRLIVLAFVAEQPRHGYEIIKLIEEKTADWYSPSPGIVYPTLTYLEDVGYLTAEIEGAKKLYTITAEGRAHLEENRDLADAVLDRLAAIGERAARWRGRERRGPAMPPLVEAALDNLRAAAAKRLADDGEAEPVVEILARAAADLRRR